MAELIYAVGDATEPLERPAVIPHICNDVGRWGAGFVMALSHKWTEPEENYRTAHKAGLTNLGDMRIFPVSSPNHDRIYVANMVAQHGIGPGDDGRPPIRYGALAACMSGVQTWARTFKVGIHAPRFGAGLAGGHWPIIESLIKELWVDAGLNVTIYDLEN